MSVWMSDVCSSDLRRRRRWQFATHGLRDCRGRELCAARRPVRIGAQERRAIRLAIDKRRQQIGVSDAIALQHRFGARVQIFMQLRRLAAAQMRSEEHTSELQSLMRISYAVFCLKKKKK